MESFSSPTLNSNDQRKKVHIPFCDVDDLAFKNRHDPNFIASITNLMQVPPTITLTNGQQMNNSNPDKDRRIFNDNLKYGGHKNDRVLMDIPDKLTADSILRDRHEEFDPSISNQNDSLNSNNNNNVHETFDDLNADVALLSPKKSFFSEHDIDDDKLAKTPQISADLYKRMKPRRQSIEIDIHNEVRLLRDKINRLEHECQINTQTNRVFYVILCGYLLIKSVSWLLNSK